MSLPASDFHFAYLVLVLTLRHKSTQFSLFFQPRDMHRVCQIQNKALYHNIQRHAILSECL